jgi:hypothetical protein
VTPYRVDEAQWFNIAITPNDVITTRSTHNNVKAIWYEFNTLVAAPAVQLVSDVVVY